MADDELNSEQINRLVQSAINPKELYRRSICKRLASQTYNQFGTEGLIDLMNGVEELGKFQAVIVADRDEIDNYLFTKFGIFDEEIMIKIQLSEEWDSFMESIVQQSSVVLEQIIDEIIKSD